MKILNKFFVICSFCFVFLVTNVSASELDFNYDSTTLNEANNCQELYANVAEYIKTNYEDFEINSNIDIQNDKVILGFGIGVNGCPTNGLIRVGLVYDINSGFDYYMSSGRYWYSVTYYNFQLSFDNNYNITGITETPGSQTTMNSWVTTPVLNFYLDWRLGTNSILTFNNQLNEDLVVNNSELIIDANTNTTLLYDVIKKLDSDFASFGQDFGSYENVSVVTYKINDEEVGTSKKVSLEIVFDDNSISSSNISYYKYGSTAYASTALVCTNKVDTTECVFNLTYDVSSEVNDKIMFDFVFDDSYDIDISDTSELNTVYINRSNIDYEYKILDFNDLSGLILYPRNYALFNRIYNSNSKEFSFVFSNSNSVTFDSSYSVLAKTTTYEQSFQYQNTYLYNLTSSGNLNYNVGTFSYFNNLSFLRISFVYDSSILNNSHYPCFVLINPNYLGALYVPDKSVYILYNSSLFDIVTTSRVVLSGENFEDHNIVFDSSISIIDDHNVSFSNSFDDTVLYYYDFDLSVVSTYNNLFEFFKDKIVSFFQLISEFFNTMPLKFQYGFSFIFILFIAIYLYRLLL